MLYDTFWRVCINIVAKKKNIFPFIDGVDVAVRNVKMVTGEMEKHCCRATK